jgi:alkaline phosphatase D
MILGAGRGLDYRAASLIHHANGPGAGYYAGVDTEGRAFLRDLEQEDLVIIESDTRRGPVDSVSLLLTARPSGEEYDITLQAALWNANADTIRITTGGIPAGRVAGNIALVSDASGGEGTSFWFSDLTAAGSKLVRHDERKLGPVLGTQHTLSRGRLRLTAQLMPLGEADNRRGAELQVQGDGGWATVATADLVVPGFTATFTVDDWDDSRSVPFRVAYALDARDGTSKLTYRGGMIRPDPSDADEIVVAAFTGNHNVRAGVDRDWFDWDEGVWFPHGDIVRHVEAHDPDFLFFSGDQVYEGASPTRADLEHPYEDYLSATCGERGAERRHQGSRERLHRMRVDISSRPIG